MVQTLLHDHKQAALHSRNSSSLDNGHTQEPESLRLRCILLVIEMLLYVSLLFYVDNLIQKILESAMDPKQIS